MPQASLSRSERIQEEMAADLRFIRRKQSIDAIAPGIAILILIGIAVFIFARP